MTQITAMLSKEFLSLVLIAIIVASPIGYWITKQWLYNFTYKVEINWWIFAAAGISVLFIASVTVSFHAIRAAVANPTKTLRKE